MDITQSIEKLRPRILDIFDHLHAHPETSWNEVNTTAFISNILTENQCTVKTFEDCTGVIGEIGKGNFTVGLRSDIDALWQEVQWDVSGQSFLWTRWAYDLGTWSIPGIEGNGLSTKRQAEIHFSTC